MSKYSFVSNNHKNMKLIYSLQANEQISKDLLKYIDNMTITDEAYDVLLNLLNVDDTLFVKIIEELKNNNLSIYDFASVIGHDSQYNEYLEKSIISQESLYNEFHNLLTRLTELKIITAGETLYNLAVAEKEYNSGAFNSEKKNAVFSLLTSGSDDPYKAFYKQSILTKILNSSALDNTQNEENKFFDSMLLSVQDYLIPIDYNHIILNDYDINFMKKNNMSEDSMKKLKSLAAYTAVQYK